MKQRVTKSTKQSVSLERGINLDVPGRALIAQADERITWHKHIAGVMAAELKTIPLEAGATLSTPDEWKQQARRTDLERTMNGHLEHARFLMFVREHLVRDRPYRLGLTDLSILEIMPRESYR